MLSHFYFVTASSFSLKFAVNLSNIKIIRSRTTENALCFHYKDLCSMVFKGKILLFVVKIVQNLQIMHCVEKNVELSLLQGVFAVATYTLELNKFFENFR
jgi:hypothetical protein